MVELIKDKFSVYMNEEHITVNVELKCIKRIDAGNEYVCEVFVKYKGQSFVKSWGTFHKNLEELIMKTIEECLDKLAGFIVNYQLSGLESEW